MTRRLLLLICAIAALTVMPATAAAEESFELTLLRASAIVRARVTKVDDAHRRIDVLERFKADPAFPDHIDRYTSDATMDGREYLFWLGNPAFQRSELPGLPLDGRPPANARFRSMDLTFPQTRDEILAIVRATLADPAAKPPRDSIFIRSGAEPPTPDDNGWLDIPRNRRAKQLALEWTRSPTPYLRMNAAAMLGEMPGPESVDALRKLLDDRHLEPQPFLKAPRDVYTVRDMAIRGLDELKADFIEPPLERYPWPITFAIDHAAGLSALALCAVAPPIASAFARRRRRHAGRFVERRSPGGTIFAAAALASALLAVTLAYFWWHGHRDGKMFIHRTRGGETWILRSGQGALQYLVVNEQWPARRISHSLVDWGPGTVDLAASFNTPDAAFAGFLFRRVSDPGGPFVGVPDERSLAQVPFWAPTGLASILPVLWLRRHRRQTRRRRRADHNQCLNCGYDLRESPRRCPECGLAVASHPAG